MPPYIVQNFIIKVKNIIATNIDSKVEDSLESDSKIDSLSARQGKVLNDKIDNMLDFFYPVGTYYETSNKSFNPNVTWGGTWVQDTKGRVTVAAGECDDEEARIYNLGDKIGKSTNWLTSIDQIPKHTHSVNIQTSGGAHGHGISVDNGQGSRDWGVMFNYSHTAAFNSGCFSFTDGTHTHQVTGNTGSTGSDATIGFSIIQSSIVVIRWHRTA